MSKINETTTAGASFGPGPTSGRFVGGIHDLRKKKRKELKEIVGNIREAWMKHKQPSTVGSVPQMGTKGSQPLVTFHSSDQDSAASYIKNFMMRRK